MKKEDTVYLTTTQVSKPESAYRLSSSLITTNKFCTKLSVASIPVKPGIDEPSSESTSLEAESTGDKSSSVSSLSPIAFA